ncbi:CLUMA_CG003809, isoform A [Clunio marinus]|uniref:CLUMA_CG003809, isoform A n=1 Tax=Clunio marinus TaxID=568069 RepID=A0A1J1HQ36_9DIPT|nr:CLUMA_CG003809, isoform A [Clunio marinus]
MLPYKSTTVNNFDEYLITFLNKADDRIAQLLKKSTDMRNGGGKVQKSTEAIRNGQVWQDAPYMARIVFGTGEHNFEGGGAIFSHRHILAAGFVVSPVSPVFNVWVGGSTRTTQRAVAVQSRVQHPNYSLFPLTNDIGIVTLAADLVFDRFVRPIALPPLGTSMIPYDNEQGTVLGFGGAPGVANTREHLQAAFMRATTPARCNSFFQHSVAQQFCAEDARLRSEVCFNDIGGPFVVLRRGEEVLVGVISDPFCIAVPTSEPALFTRVSAYRTWINQMTSV